MERTTVQELIDQLSKLSEEDRQRDVAFYLMGDINGIFYFVPDIDIGTDSTVCINIAPYSEARRRQRNAKIVSDIAAGVAI